MSLVGLPRLVTVSHAADLDHLVVRPDQPLRPDTAGPPGREPEGLPSGCQLQVAFTLAAKFLNSRLAVLSGVSPAAALDWMLVAKSVPAVWESAIALV